MSGGGACLVACIGQERGRESSAEGASERGEVGEQRAASKGGWLRAQVSEGKWASSVQERGTWSENARSWARPRRGTWAGGWGTE
jgi:hypothetical protein